MLAHWLTGAALLPFIVLAATTWVDPDSLGRALEGELFGPAIGVAGLMMHILSVYAAVTLAYCGALYAAPVPDSAPASAARRRTRPPPQSPPPRRATRLPWSVVPALWGWLVVSFVDLPGGFGWLAAGFGVVALAGRLGPDSGSGRSSDAGADAGAVPASRPPLLTHRAVFAAGAALSLAVAGLAP